MAAVATCSYVQCYRCYEVACMATNLAHMHTDRNTFVHVPVIQHDDTLATSTSSQLWEYQTGCNVNKNWIQIWLLHI